MLNCVKLIMARGNAAVLMYLFLSTTAAMGDEEGGKTIEEEKYGVKYAEECEVCKYFVVELEERLKQTGKSHEVIETGYELDQTRRRKKKYKHSELRLVESLDGICDNLLNYNIHKERKDSTRFAKGMSTTFKVLHDLVDKGVKVDLGIPFELWDKPSAEVTNLKSQCENLLEKYESDIEDWYFKHQDIPLRNFLCIERALLKGDTGCLEEEFVDDSKKKKGEKRAKKKSKKSSVEENAEKEGSLISEKEPSDPNVKVEL